MLSSLVRLFKKNDENKNNAHKIQTFTYFVPAPPLRNSPYREKQFDSIMYQFLNMGYELISIQTQSNQSTNSPGMWVICTVRGTNFETDKLNLNDFEEVKLSDDHVLSVRREIKTIEGLYQVDHED